MNIFTKILLGMSVSILLYSSVFIVFKKPITLGHIHHHQINKFNYAKNISDKPKIVIIGGSNGMFSYNCSVITKETGKNCVNSSIGVGLGIDYILEKSKNYLKKGDTALLTLEYIFYSSTKKDVNYAVTGNNYIYQYDRDYIFKFDLDKTIAIVFSFEFVDLLNSVVEILIDNLIKGNKFLVKVTKSGDVTDHTKEKAQKFTTHINNSMQVKPSSLIASTDFYSQQIITNFLKWCHKNDVQVVATLPTIFNDKPINKNIIKKISSLYNNKYNDISFVLTDTNSQYSRDCFYDTPYHLNMECQKTHSKAISRFLKAKTK